MYKESNEGSNENPSDSMYTQSGCVSKLTLSMGRALRAVERGEFFPAIIKQFNWICSYARELLVWISISMPSHKLYFQVHWTLSSAKLILHDMQLSLCIRAQRQTPVMQVTVTYISSFQMKQSWCLSGITFLQSLKKFSRNTFFVVYSWSNIWAKNNATSSAVTPSFTFFPADKQKTRPSKSQSTWTFFFNPYSGWIWCPQHIPKRLTQDMCTSVRYRKSF